MVNFTVKQVNLEKTYPASGGWWIARWNGAISDEWGWVGPGMAQMDAHFFNRAEEGVLGIYIASLSNGTEAEPPNLSFQLTIKDGQVVTVDFETGRLAGAGGPQFSPGSVHKATITFSNPKSAGFDYSASLYMGAAITVMAFHLDAGQSKPVTFSVTMPAAIGTYPVYIAVLSGGKTIALYKATEVTIATPSVADIRVENLVISPTEVNIGKPVTISVVAKNYGTAAGSKVITCNVV